MGRDAQEKVRKKNRNLRCFHLKHREIGSFDRETTSNRARLTKICRMAALKMILFGLALSTSLFRHLLIIE